MFTELLLLSICQIGKSIICNCNHESCNLAINNGKCWGNYCYAYRRRLDSPLEKFGCLTTRQNASTFGCEQDANGAILCLCQKDLCNNKDLPFTPSVKLPSHTCTLYDPYRCVYGECKGPYCLAFNYTGNEALREMCDTMGYDGPSRVASTSLRAFTSIVDVDVDSCALTQSKKDSMLCNCKQNNCTAFRGVNSGNLTCYTDDKNSTCEEGVYCYIRVSGNDPTERGCLQLWTSSPVDLHNFTTTVGNMSTYICNTSLCNDVMVFNSTRSHLHTLFLIVLLIIFTYSCRN